MPQHFQWSDDIISDAVITLLAATEQYAPVRSSPPPVVIPGDASVGHDALDFMSGLLTGRQSLVDASRAWCQRLTSAQHDHAELDRALAARLPNHAAVPGRPAA